MVCTQTGCNYPEGDCIGTCPRMGQVVKMPRVTIEDARLYIKSHRFGDVVAELDAKADAHAAHHVRMASTDSLSRMDKIGSTCMALALFGALYMLAVIEPSVTAIMVGAL